MTIRLFSNLSYEIEERILMFLDTYTIRMIVENTPIQKLFGTLSISNSFWMGVEVFEFLNGILSIN
jgi:hypothetical protein